MKYVKSDSLPWIRTCFQNNWSWHLPGTSAAPTGSLGDDTRSPPAAQCAPRVQVFSDTASPVWLWRHSRNLINTCVLGDSLQKSTNIVCSLGVDRRRRVPLPQGTTLHSDSEIPLQLVRHEKIGRVTVKFSGSSSGLLMSTGASKRRAQTGAPASSSVQLWQQIRPVSLAATAAALRSSSSDPKGFVFCCWGMQWGCGHWLPVTVPAAVLIQGGADSHCCLYTRNTSIHEYIPHLVLLCFAICWMIFSGLIVSSVG